MILRVCVCHNIHYSKNQTLQQQSAIQGMYTSLAKFECRLDSLEAELMEQKRRTKAVEGENSNLKSLCQTLLDDNDSLKEKLEESEWKRQEEQKELETIASNATSLWQRCHDMETKIDAMTSVINEMHAIVTATKEPKRRTR